MAKFYTKGPGLIGSDGKNSTGIVHCTSIPPGFSNPGLSHPFTVTGIDGVDDHLIHDMVTLSSLHELSQGLRASREGVQAAIAAAAREIQAKLPDGATFEL